MNRATPWALALALTAVLLLMAGCGETSGVAEDEAGAATVYEIEGSDVSRVELTAGAAKRLDVRTGTVARNGGEMVVPYSAVLYAPDGETWVFVSPKPLTFVRKPIVIERIEGPRAFLAAGPKLGTTVATRGVAEIHGAELGLGQ